MAAICSAILLPDPHASISGSGNYMARSELHVFITFLSSLFHFICSSPGDGITKLVCFTRSFQAFAKLTSQADDRLSADDDVCMS